MKHQITYPCGASQYIKGPEVLEKLKRTKSGKYRVLVLHPEVASKPRMPDGSCPNCSMGCLKPGRHRNHAVGRYFTASGDLRRGIFVTCMGTHECIPNDN